MNVGVVLVESSGSWAEVRFTQGLEAGECLDPEADVETAGSDGRRDPRAVERGREGGKWLLKRMEDTFRTRIRLTEPKAVLAETPRWRWSELAEMYLESREKGAREQTGEDADVPHDARRV